MIKNYIQNFKKSFTVSSFLAYALGGILATFISQASTLSECLFMALLVGLVGIFILNPLFEGRKNKTKN
ncbi:hypothetical protein QR692_10070 [Lactococcus petauri]|uniref:hypothetical protein n=1 Tax=Lactococcus petauri TaxID=1940789 RepID=UPI002078F0F1|nr:hypothetical protein [Lactococcus petauri]USI65328.1 hypothetical protein LMK05_10955 [Lactococcus petauri]USI67823.1 hypothetical protein LMK04_10190 [Lactococcus petauri]WJE12484.1 hypothetical protein QR692_10070 [Lactococcus petauri]